MHRSKITCNRSPQRYFYFIVLMVVIYSTKGFAQTDGRQIQHQIVFSEAEKYGGWPANHGIWSWGDEILVGFVAADYNETNAGLHTYNVPTARNRYARSFDGGVHWKVTDAYELGQKAAGYDNHIPATKAVVPTVLKKPIEDATDPDFLLTFLRHDNDYGPSHFYYSTDKGMSWQGPYVFPDMGTPGIANRTDYVVDGEKALSVFVTVAKSNKKEGRVALARTKDGGLTWQLVAYVTPEHGGFDIMPSSLRLSESELLTTIRTRTEGGQNLISSYRSMDNGQTWERLQNPAPDTGTGGSPPALTLLKDGRLALGYIHRSEYGSRLHVRFSDDDGETWGDEITLRSGDGASRDAGYPRITQRADGKLVMVYYWNHSLVEDAEPYRYIAATIFDPEDWK